MITIDICWESAHGPLGLPHTAEILVADGDGRALLWTPNPVQPGSSISHFDQIASPDQLMEPNINSDLTHSVTPPQDLTFILLEDLGW